MKIQFHSHQLNVHYIDFILKYNKCEQVRRRAPTLTPNQKQQHHHNHIHPFKHTHTQMIIKCSKLPESIDNCVDNS